jgi:hypothetical protein
MVHPHPIIQEMVEVVQQVLVLILNQEAKEVQALLYLNITSNNFIITKQLS